MSTTTTALDQQHFIEITQDGAAIIETGSATLGIATAGLQTRAVHAIFGKDASAFVHDTSPRPVASLACLVNKINRPKGRL